MLWVQSSKIRNVFYELQSLHLILVIIRAHIIFYFGINRWETRLNCFKCLFIQSLEETIIHRLDSGCPPKVWKNGNLTEQVSFFQHLDHFCSHEFLSFFPLWAICFVWIGVFALKLLLKKIILMRQDGLVMFIIMIWMIMVAVVIKCFFGTHQSVL